MEWRLNKKQIAEVTAMFTELCEKITDREISLSLCVRKSEIENGEMSFTYEVYAIYKGKIIYIKMGEHQPLMAPCITNDEVEEIITLLKGDK